MMYISLEINRKLCIRMLRMAGVTCMIETASNGADALQSLQHHTYTLILMDVSMPIMVTTRHMVTDKLTKRNTSHRVCPILMSTLVLMPPCAQGSLNM